MPANPPAIHGPPSAAPAVPGALHSAPAAAPVAPGAVHVVPTVGGGSGDELIVSGTLTPDGTGALTAVASPSTVTYPGGRQWSEDGNSTPPGSGDWLQLYQALLVTPEAATLAALAPVAGYLTGESLSDASQVQVINADYSGGFTTYWLWDNGGTREWRSAANFAAGSQNSLVITAGKAIFVRPRTGPGPAIGGLLASWQVAPSTEWVWVSSMRTAALTTSAWRGVGTLPTTATWYVFGGSLGVPVVAGLGGLVAPPSILAGAPALSPVTVGPIFTAPASTPNTPPVITA